MEESVDNTSGMPYNDSNDLNEIVTDLAVVPPINDIECTHSSLTADPSDTIGDAIYHGCDNRKCGMGFYIQPTK